MKIWIDADSCPKQVRDLVYKRTQKLVIPLIFVANRQIPFDASPHCTMIVKSTDPDAADDHIVEHAKNCDLVITRDIPLAKRLVNNGIRVLNDRGIVYTDININERLSMRNLMYDLYSAGIFPEKTNSFGKKEIQEFANAFDRELTRLIKQNNIF